MKFLKTKTVIIGLIGVLLAGEVFAEDSPQIRALNLRISSEINTNMQCTTAAFDLQDKLSVAQSEVKRLTDKYEPKKNEAK